MPAADEPAAARATPRPHADIRTRAIKSTGWYAASRLFTQVLSWSVTLVLARLLAPSDYGLYGMAFVIIGFLEVFQSLGLGVAIIQRQDLTRPQINGMFWVCLASGVALLGIVWALAGPVAAYYGDPRLVWIVRALGFIFVIAAAGAIPSVLLTKEIDFRRRSLGEAAAVVPGAVIALALAYRGYGVWALVFGELTRSSVRTLVLLAVTGWRPSLDVSFRDLRQLLGFGSNVMGVMVIRELSPVLETAVVGRLLGSQALGLYSMAATLGVSPINRLSSAVINQLSLPVFAKIQTDLERLRSAFLAITRYIATVSFPLQVGMAMVAADLIGVLLSEQWRPIVFLLQVMSIGGIWNVVVLPAPPLLTARGKVRLTLYTATAMTTIMPLALAVGARFGLTGIAVAWAIVYCSIRSVTAVLAVRELELSLPRYLRHLAPPAVSVAVMAAAICLVRLGWPLPERALARLLRDVAVGAAVYPSMLLVVDQKLGGEMRGIWRTLVARGGSS